MLAHLKILYNLLYNCAAITDLFIISLHFTALRWILQPCTISYDAWDNDLTTVYCCDSPALLCVWTGKFMAMLIWTHPAAVNATPFNASQ